MVKTLFRNIGLILLCGLFLFGCTPEKKICHDANGKTIEIASLKNKWIVLNFWASWCHTCAAEMPELNSFYKNNTNQNILIYGINLDNLQGDELQQAIKNFGIEFPVFADAPNALQNLGYDVEAVPTTFIIDSNGNIVKKFVGMITEKTLSDFFNVSS